MVGSTPEEASLFSFPRTFIITGASSAEQYSFLPEAIRAEARRRMVTRFYELDRRNPKAIRIRDDHFVYLREDRSYFTRPYASGDKAQLLAMVVLVAEKEIIANRRLCALEDRPERNLIDLDVIAEHQSLEIKTAGLQARHLRIPFKIFDTSRLEVRDVAQAVSAFIKEVAVRRG